MAKPAGYSGIQILLHWVIGLLIVFQLIFGEDMGQAWNTFEKGGVPVMGTMVWAHILVGIAVLLLALWRLTLRLTRGAPPAPKGESAAATLAAHITHWTFYALMILFPVTGLLAWYGGYEAMAEVHQFFKPVLIVLILLHLVAALWHQFWLKDNLLARMKGPQT